MSDNTPKLWQLARNGEEFGPYTSQELAAMGKGGRITSDMTVRLQGVEQWQNVSRVKGLHITQVVPTRFRPCQPSHCPCLPYRQQPQSCRQVDHFGAGTAARLANGH